MHADDQARLAGAAPAPAAPAAKRERGVTLRVLTRLVRWLGWTTALLLVAALLVAATMRFYVLPNIDDYRATIEARASQAAGAKVTIGRIDGRWVGIRPHVDLHEVKVLDAAGTPALALEKVHTVLSWRSFAALDLRLRRLEIDGPELAIRRDEAGKFYVAGIEVTPRQGGSGGADWLLEQGEVLIRNATVRWNDAQRKAPELALSAVNLRLNNFGSHHRLGVTAQPPEALAAPLDIRGDFRGSSFAQPEDWRGELYVMLERADLAVWRQWVDYPIELPRGAGALRLWANLEHARLAGFTADFSLDDVQMRLGTELPMLDLDAFSGRLAARTPPGGLELKASNLKLQARGRGEAKPVDFVLRWNAAAEAKPAYGELTATRFNLGALSDLAEHLPLDAATRAALGNHKPQGEVADLAVAWSGDEKKLVSWRGRARVTDAALSPHGNVPGFSKVSGSFEASQEGGTLTLTGRGAELDLPAVMPERRIALDTFDAKLNWKSSAERTEISIVKVALANADIAGSLSGRFETAPERKDSPGVLDLQGSFSRGQGSAVWKYLPFVVSQDARTWLRSSLPEGTAQDIRLKIKGDLAGYPWIGDRGGEFDVSAKFAGARLRYAPGWPELSGLSGDLRFHGDQMVVRAHGAGPNGLRVNETTAEIGDLMHAQNAMLKIRGAAEGPTADFLTFVKDSPVSRAIDHVTDEMRASGAGTLTLAIDMPLANIDATHVAGAYQFSANQLVPVPGMSPLTEAGGKIEFTEKGVTIRNATANLLGAPVTISAQTQPGGTVSLTARGSTSVTSLRGTLDAAVLDHLSGTVAWTAGIAVRGANTSLVVDSTLEGVSSSLPEPLNKSVGTSMPLHLEFGRAPGEAPGSDEIRATLDKTLDVRLIRKRESAAPNASSARMVLDRGGIGVGGEPAPQATRGLAVAGKLAALDIDAWRKALGAGEGGNGLPVASVNLRAGKLTAFGQRFNDFAMRATQADGAWQCAVESREMNGDLTWRAAERGRLRARLKNLALNEVQETGAAKRPKTPRAADDMTRELPGVDVVAESFSLRGKPLGKLELVAANRANTWQIEKLAIASPDGVLTGTGLWHMQTETQRSETELSFKLESENVGKLLDRLGYADAVRKGSAKFGGKLSWNGAPTDLDPATLSGDLTLDAANGQFNKLEPGVGRLLGVLSLQSLPRRISLDFRDIFSDGFAWDSISGSMKVSRGVMSTDNLRIRGPAARIDMSGSTDLDAETQRLRVKVQPTLSEGVALGAAIANPVAGLATLVAQKVFKDPIEKLFAYEYDVTGTWADPQVTKVGSGKQAPAASPQGAPESPAAAPDAAAR